MLLEKIMISRIMHHLQSKDLLNKNQFGFVPGSCTTDALTKLKEIVEENLRDKNYTILISLDVKGAFNAAWWPAILHSLKELKCPKNLYKLSLNYFSERTAEMNQNSINISKSVTKGVQRDHVVDRAFGTFYTIHY